MDQPNLSRENYRQAKTALKELQSKLKKQFGKQAPTIMVYGSYARKQARADSDIDVLLVYPLDIQPGEEIRRIGSILAGLNLRYQVLISVLPVSQTAFLQAEGSLWENIRKEGKLVSEI